MKVRILDFFLSFMLPALHVSADVVDSATQEPIAGVSVFDNKGNFIGSTDSKGKLPPVFDSSLPLVLRCVGYNEIEVDNIVGDIRLVPVTYSLPELLVQGKERKVLHLLAYVREYSTLSTYTDTVNMYREKWCDFMVASDAKSKFKGWLMPRILLSRSYYRFTDCYGLDSVSDRFNNHFTWCDWVGINRSLAIPLEIDTCENGSHFVKGKYGDVTKWYRTNDKIRLEIDVLADSSRSHWIPGMSRFFEQNVDFNLLKLDYKFEDFVGQKVEARDLRGFSINVESRGRGRNMFKFNHVDQPFFVSTYAEVLIVD